MSRTFAIGDIHGDRVALEKLLEKLPVEEDDTVVFLGDYVDRGPDSRGVVDRVRRFAAEHARTVLLRVNHEDKWVDCLTEPELGFLLPRGNGCLEMYRSFVGRPLPAPEDGPSAEEFQHFCTPSAWLPADVGAWMASLPLWYEDDHAIYVHAGLDGEGHEWKHPRDGAEKPLLWMREPDFYANYRGKTVVFGHTPTKELPLDHLGPIKKIFDDPCDVWVRNDLIAIDTGAGKGGFLSAVELPRLKVYESR